MNGWLLDTCVLVDLLRDYDPCTTFLAKLGEKPEVSVVTIAELRAGIRNQHERKTIDELTETLVPRSIEIEIAVLAGDFCHRYRRSHGVEIPDALIAATAEVHGLRLVTRNARHFPMLDDVLVPYA